MTTVINDRDLEHRLIARRRARGTDKFDEVWNGVYFMSPLANNEHQVVAGRIYAALLEVVERNKGGQVFPGANISDRRGAWRRNFRCPDVAVYLNGNPAEDCGTHWLGGPDLAVEVVSKGDRARKKLSFYSQVGTRELLIIDRNPWKLELFRLTNDSLILVGTATVDDGRILQSAVLDLDFSLAAAAPRPQLVIAGRNDDVRWTI